MRRSTVGMRYWHVRREISRSHAEEEANGILNENETRLLALSVCMARAGFDLVS
jgi:hypothetical protein